MGRFIPPPSVTAAGLRARNALGRVHDRILPPAAFVIERLAGLVEVRMLGVVCELRVPDLLDAGPMTVDALARMAGADADALGRVLRFLVSRGIFRHERDGRYANNSVSDVLRADHPDSMRDWALFIGASWHASIWSRADASVRTGASATEAAFGTPFFDYVQHQNPAAGAQFDAAMASGSRLQAQLLLRSYDFAGAASVCDVGGGTGTVLAEVLRRHRNLRGTLFDRPSVIAKVTNELDGVTDRCQLVGGDFFTEVPAGHDLYMLLAIVHDWGDEHAGTILGTVRAAMPAHGRVIVVDSVMPDHDRADLSKQFDVLMLVLTGSGRERTRAEFDRVFGAAGLRVARDITLPNLFHVFELAAA